MKVLFFNFEDYPCTFIELPSDESAMAMDVDQISFAVPPQILESSIEDDTLREYEGESTTTITYELIVDGSPKGKEKLADSEGYTYTVKT